MNLRISGGAALRGCILPVIVAVGASGVRGLEDLQALLSALPDDLRAIVLIVLHRPAHLESSLHEILSRRQPTPVVVARDGQRLTWSQRYIGEPSRHLTLGSGCTAQLIHDPTHAYRNRTADALFHSVAEHAGRNGIGVVLSGGLDDGARGLAAIKAAGGGTLVRTPASRSAGGMPESAIRHNDPVDVVGMPRDLAEWLVQRIRNLRC